MERHQFHINPWRLRSSPLRPSAQGAGGGSEAGSHERSAVAYSSKVLRQRGFIGDIMVI